jgi:hypothetical protein
VWGEVLRSGQSDGTLRTCSGSLVLGNPGYGKYGSMLASINFFVARRPGGVPFVLQLHEQIGESLAPSDLLKPLNWNGVPEHGSAEIRWMFPAKVSPFDRFRSTHQSFSNPGAWQCCVRRWFGRQAQVPLNCFEPRNWNALRELLREAEIPR